MAYARQELVLSRWLGTKPKFRSAAAAPKAKPKGKANKIDSEETTGVVSL